VGTGKEGNTIKVLGGKHAIKARLKQQVRSLSYKRGKEGKVAGRNGLKAYQGRFKTVDGRELLGSNDNIVLI